MGRTEQGFTLIELLGVLLIVGILTGILFAQYTGTRQIADINSAARQIQADLQGARDASLRLTQYGLLSVAADGKSYTVSSCAAANGTGCVSTRTRLSPASTVTYAVSSGGAAAVNSAARTVTYTPPDGEQPSATGYTFTVSSTVNSARAVVRLIGLSGKAVINVAR